MFQDDEIGNARHNVDRGGFAQRPIRPVVRRHHDVVRFGLGRDLLHLRDATHPPHVRLKHVHNLALHELTAAVDGARSFTRGHRDTQRVRNLLQGVHVFRRDRILIEHEVELFQFVPDPDSFRRCQPRWPVHVDAEVDIRGKRITEPLDRPDRMAETPGLQRGIALRNELLGVLRFTGVGVHPDPFAAHPTQQINHRGVEFLAQDVPQGNLNTRHGARANDTSHAVTHHAEHHLLPDQLNPGRVKPDQDGLEILYRRLDDFGPTRRLTPTDKTLVGLHLDKEPVPATTTPSAFGGCINEEGLDVGDLHEGSPCRCLAPTAKRAGRFAVRRRGVR